jgi:CHASE3 domain sensor protein
MKLYIAPKLKELHRNLMSAEAFKQASLVYRYIITGNRKYLNSYDEILRKAAASVGLNLLSPEFDSTSFQR